MYLSQKPKSTLTVWLRQVVYHTKPSVTLPVVWLNDSAYLRASLRSSEEVGSKCRAWSMVHKKKQLSVNRCSEEQSFFYFMWLSGLCASLCVCITCVPGACQDWKRLLKLELQTVASCPVSARNWIQEQSWLLGQLSRPKKSVALLVVSEALLQQ